MDAILDDVTATVRKTVLTRAQNALEHNDIPRAVECYRTLAQMLRVEARNGSDDQAGEKKLVAADHFDAQADMLETGGGPRREAGTSTELHTAPPTDVWAAASPPPVTLDDVVGLREVKTLIRQTVLNPLAHPRWAAEYGVGADGGILFYGPPGTGKTMTGRAIAGTLGVPFYQVKAGDMLSKWQGESENNLAALFAEARRHEKCVVFIDEFQWLAPRQDDADMSETGRRLLSQLLQELQAVRETSGHTVIFLAATNYPWQLDGAAIRIGRFRKHLYVPPPDHEARGGLFARGLDGKPIGSIDYARLAELTEGYMAADIVGICDAAACAALDAAVASNRRTPISQQLIEHQIETTVPSASPELVSRCEQWARRHQ